MKCGNCQADETPAAEITEFGSYDKQYICASCHHAMIGYAQNTRRAAKVAKVEALLPPTHLEQQMTENTVSDLVSLLGELS